MILIPKKNRLHYFSSKLGLMVSIITLLFIVSDIGVRFAEKAGKINKTTPQFVIEPLAMPQIAQSTISQLQDSYQKYQTPEKPAAEINNNVISAEAQAKQQGRLQKFYINDHSLQLKSIIKNDEKQAIALILVTNVKSNSTKLEKFENNQPAYGYRLTIANNTQVKLTQLAIAPLPTQPQTLNQTLQQVTLTMYK
ncbi:MAG: hypothetical protein ACJAT7_001327 [Psychromonas sp.]|uniref:hypothetical protein n=1 Tax=Psychromonas sp. TaxID=1884585 RepID=UPI0039E40A60